MKTFWVCCDRDSFNIVRHTSEPGLGWSGVWRGPFKTLREAKRAAKEYYECDKRDAQTNLYELKVLKLKDVEWYKK